MFLLSLELENVRSIAHLKISFAASDEITRKWTLLIGENGCGKSTILRSAALLMAGSNGLPELLGSPDSWIRFGQKSCRFRATLTTAQKKLRTIEFTLHRGDRMADVFERNRAGLRAIDDALAKAFRNYMTIGYGVSRRFSPEGQFVKQEAYRSKRARSLATMFSPDATLQPLQNWAMDMDYRRRGAGLAVVKETLRDLLPGVEFERIDRESRKVFFKTPDGVVPFEQLSDGYQNVAAWCGDLVYRVTEMNPDYEHPLHARGLLLIDEIDLHLHPIWQRNLRDYLDRKFPHLQILATTHSALTAQQCGKGELFFLKREKSKGPVVYPFAGEPRKMMVHQLLLSPMFGLDTLDSSQVEGQRKELRALKAKRAKNGSDRSRAAELKEELADVPDWSTQSLADKEEISLLKEIRNELGKKGGNAPAVKPKRGGMAK
jgi:predicted ATPase